MKICIMGDALTQKSHWKGTMKQLRFVSMCTSQSVRSKMIDEGILPALGLTPQGMPLPMSTVTGSILVLFIPKSNKLPCSKSLMKVDFCLGSLLAL